MATDFLEQLAQSHVPPPPEEFDRQVHERLNKSLLGTHLLDLSVHGMLFAAGHFAQALLHLIVLTLSGRPEVGPRDRPSAPPEPPQ